MPASLAMAGRCRTVFVEPPSAMSTTMAFLKALGVSNAPRRYALFNKLDDSYARLVSYSAFLR